MPTSGFELESSKTRVAVGGVSDTDSAVPAFHSFTASSMPWRWEAPVFAAGPVIGPMTPIVTS